MKRTPLLLLMVFLGGSVWSYSVEFTLSPTQDVGYQKMLDQRWGTDSGTMVNNLSLSLGVGIPLGLGKLYLQANPGFLGTTGGLGYGGEWVVVDWLSVEAALVAKAGVYSFWWYPNKPKFFYAGVEPMVRANLLFWDGHIVVGIGGGGYMRWFDQWAVQTGVPFQVTVGLRF